MAVDERSRHALYRKLEEVLGPDEALTFMELVPVTDFDGIATKHDVALVRSEMVQLGTELRSEMGQLRTELRSDMTVLRADMETLRYELLAAFRGELNAALTSQTRSLIYANSGLFVGFAGLVLALKLA